MTEELIDQLCDYEHGPFDEREKAALRYAEQVYFEFQAIDNAYVQRMRARFSDAEFMELNWAIGEFISLGKIIKIIELPYGEGSGDFVPEPKE